MLNWTIAAFLLLAIVAIRVLQRENQALRIDSAIKDQEREAVLTFLNRIGEAFTRELNLDETLSMIGEFIVEETLAESGAIYIFDEKEEYLRARVVVGLFPPLHETLGYVLTKRKHVQDKVKSERIRRGESIIGAAAEKGESYLITDAAGDDRVPDAARSLVPMQSLMVAPLKVRDKVLGVMAVVNKTIGEGFDRRDMGLLEALADQAAVTVNIVSLYGQIAEKQRIEQELRVAEEFQRLLLPKTDPVIDGYDLAGFSVPARQVGGDYFDFIQLDDDNLGFCVADVCGKGIPGGLVMAAARSTLRAEARVSLSPREVMIAVNKHILADTKENVFITMTYGILNIPKGTATFVRAGHEPVLQFDAEGGGPPRLHSPAGLAVGLVDNEMFAPFLEEQTISLEPGESIFLYTDGVIEAMNDKSEEYGDDRFMDVLRRGAGDPCRELIEEVDRDIASFSGGIAPHDDITMLAIRRLPKAAANVRPIARAAGDEEEEASGAS